MQYVSLATALAKVEARQLPTASKWEAGTTEQTKQTKPLMPGNEAAAKQGVDTTPAPQYTRHGLEKPRTGPPLAIG
ncbi:hypothetical protein CCMA1212_001462 [Trichoderma ghanense]|uniref:Uncharacterized protein n=1 Tax=Trichoderma ghanense TaxID=65468 RepID=A0ABY2HE64_9HYPO